MVQHADIDHTGIPGVGAGSFSGQPVAVAPVGSALIRSSTNSQASNARACPIVIPATMRVRSLWIDISSSTAGQIQWGLFDYSSDETACVKLCGGQNAPGGTDWREFVVSSATPPVVVPAGAYMLIMHQPAATQPTIHTAAHAAAAGFWKSYTTYTWDDTPNLTDASWVAATAVFNAYLEGDLDASGTRW